MSVGNTVANRLLKGHWARSYQRVVDKVCKIAEEKRAHNTVAFSRPSSKSVLLPLQVLCRKTQVEIFTLIVYGPSTTVIGRKQDHGGKLKRCLSVWVLLTKLT